MSSQDHHCPTDSWECARATLPPAIDSTQQGAFLRDGGVDFVVAAPGATAVELCIFSSDDSQAAGSDADFAGGIAQAPGGRAQETEVRYRMHPHEGGLWSAHKSGVGGGTQYGYRVSGPWDPDGGLVYNPHKLLLDPYGRGLEREVQLHPALYAHRVDSQFTPLPGPLQPDLEDSAPYQGRSVVVKDTFEVTAGPGTSWDETVVYELHVKGFTKNMPGVPAALRGSYAGLAHPQAISHLKSLGVTAVELLPVHAKWDEPFLQQKGMTNYWGYSTLSFFTPEPSLASPGARANGAGAVAEEFKGMVSLLHEAGIEVLLDVVYNHTCEGGLTGPMLSWRGFSQSTYYRHTQNRPVVGIDDTGCGNTVNFDEARVLEMTLDSLRYWAGEMGVDGFRFDLAGTLGRYADGYTPRHPFFMALAADPLLKTKKLIAEPWDIGPGGWQTGNFPLPWSEWNDRYRDTIRGFWLADFANLERGEDTQGPNDIATRISGSADLFGETNGHPRPSRSSLNFITAHDGFTLADLTAFNHKNNYANGENNQDGTSRNLSWNHGLEGHPRAGKSENTQASYRHDPMLDAVFYPRERSIRNLLATLLFSVGTPMIVAGDEIGRTQNGNNNAYCQDSPISWINWDLDTWQRDLFDTVRYLIALRRNHPVMRPNAFASGSRQPGDELEDLSWRTADNHRLHPHEWHDPAHRVLQFSRSGKPWNDCDLLVVFNATLNTATVNLRKGRGINYRLVFDSSWVNPSEGGGLPDASNHQYCDIVEPGTTIHMEPQSLQLYLTERP
ncbi:glycogen debranching protein GlgX [Gleimia hominis]|uniref:glycogen debranching protein GlgX n=1 Tax=Gleimia hominis TaxID=595468 RepID=UPI000C7FDC08|nr:glycogen debranching protein GlgX [Gleimia hominis]WIK64843.1 glycogen debranching protein GlgX [Gleimia hominis]